MDNMIHFVCDFKRSCHSLWSTGKQCLRDFWKKEGMGKWA